MVSNFPLNVSFGVNFCTWYVPLFPGTHTIYIYIFVLFNPVCSILICGMASSSLLLLWHSLISPAFFGLFCNCQPLSSLSQCFLPFDLYLRITTFTLLYYMLHELIFVVFSLHSWHTCPLFYCPQFLFVLGPK